MSEARISDGGPAFPQFDTDYHPHGVASNGGMSKRELIAMHAMQGMLCRQAMVIKSLDKESPLDFNKRVAEAFQFAADSTPRIAVIYADALLAALAEPKS